MPLPKLDVPVYELKLISTGKKIRFRPFLVKEQKLFLMAAESNDPEETISTIKQVLNNCVIDEINLDELPIFDIEYLFLNLRAKSVSEVIALKYKCNNVVEEKKCNSVIQFDLNLLDIKPEAKPNHNKKVDISSKMGIMMKYPTIQISNKLKEYDNIGVDSLIEVIIQCIDYIYDEENVYYAKDTPKQELIDFVENLQQDDLEKIKNFFETSPKVSKNLEFKCVKCGYEENIVVEGIQNFFV